MGWEGEAPGIESSAGWEGEAPPTRKPGRSMTEELAEFDKERDTLTPPEWAGRYPNLYGVYGAGKELSKVAAETYAMTRGAKTGASVGRTPGALIGSGLGLAAAKGVESKIGQPTKPLEYEDIGFDTLVGTLAQGAGMGINKALSPLAKRITPAIQSIENKAREVFGITLSPAEVTQSKTLALWESLMDKSPFSASEVLTTDSP